jgi:hypothetical protein
MALSSDQFPSKLPRWIRDLAVAFRDGKPNSLDLTVADDAECLWRLLSHSEVATLLENLDKHALVEQNDARSDIVELLCWTCHIHRQSKNLVIETPSKLKTKLKNLAKNAEKLACALEEQSNFLGPAINAHYLLGRLAANHPDGFVATRTGLRRARYSIEKNPASLADLLFTFRDDIREDISDFPNRLTSLDGGDDAQIRYQIKMLKKLYRNLFSRCDNSAVSNILSAINNQDIDHDRVKKTAA